MQMQNNKFRQEQHQFLSQTGMYKFHRHTVEGINQWQEVWKNEASNSVDSTKDKCNFHWMPHLQMSQQIPESPITAISLAPHVKNKPHTPKTDT